MASFWDVIHTDIALKMVAVSTSEASVNMYQTRRRGIPEDSHLCTCVRDNLKSQSILVIFLQSIKILRSQPLHNMAVVGITTPRTDMRGRVQITAEHLLEQLRQSVRAHETTRERLDGFARNLILELFTKICR
jgi:hypothetical protein